MTEAIDYGALRFWFDVVQLVGLIMLGVYSWLANRDKANQRAIRQVGQDVGDLQRRMDRVESQARNAPTHEDLGKIYHEINTVARSVSEMSGQLRGIGRSVELMNEHLLSQGDRGK